MAGIIVPLMLIVVGAVVAIVAGVAAYFVSCGHSSLATLIDLAFWLQAAALGGTLVIAGLVHVFT